MGNETENKNAPIFSMKHMFMLLGVLLGFYLNWSYVEVSVLVAIIWIVLIPTTSWQLARISLVYFILMSVFILYKMDTQALQLAMGANLFLVLSVLLAAWDVKKR